LLTKPEIEFIIGSAVSERKPDRLDPRFPLLGLPDNPYTLYALGALKGIASDEHFRTVLASAAASRQGRAAARLRYVSGI